ncbi:MAG: 2-C-methyl-D-erythritol 2,4-cyclodiphosphate synthase [Caldisericia bacterium]|nr:2-C-methyl-D-erythritol 2,4-cyclodiphosphate synthase [Caldisericia bacterium]
MRIGIGFDFHIIKKNLPMYIGGVLINKDFGFYSNTDGDILIHAIVDAILGAIGEKDIGELFDENWKGRSSIKILENTLEIMRNKNFEIVNIDAVIILEKPKIIDFKDIILENLSKIMKIDKEKINIKGKTMEKIGFIGKRKGGASFVVVLLKEIC